MKRFTIETLTVHLIYTNFIFTIKQVSFFKVTGW